MEMNSSLVSLGPPLRCRLRKIVSSTPIFEHIPIMFNVMQIWKMNLINKWLIYSQKKVTADEVFSFFKYTRSGLPLTRPSKDLQNPASMTLSWCTFMVGHICLLDCCATVQALIPMACKSPIANSPIELADLLAPYKHWGMIILGDLI